MKKKPESNITPGNERKYRELLEASEERYRALYENSLDAIMITSQDGTVYSANPAACRMLGYSEYEICSLGRKGIVDNTPQLFKALEQRRETGKYIGELTCIKKDGTKFPVELSSSVFSNSDGRELTTLIIRDISERKKTEKALLESEARLRLASQATGFGLYSYDFGTRVTYFSDEFLALYGILPGDTIEHTLDLLSRSFHPEDREHFFNAIKKANDPEGPGILDIEFRIIKPDGEIRWLKASGRTVFSGNSVKDKPLHANGLMQDITFQKKTEESLVESRNFLTSIIDSTNDLIWAVNPHTFKLLTFNKALEQFFERNNIIISEGAILDDFLPKELSKKLHDLYSLTLKKGSLTTEYQTSIGNLTLWMSLNVLSREGTPYAISVFAKNITELKKSELAIKQANEWQEKIFEGSLDAIFISDEDSLLIAVNKAACDLTGYSREELLEMLIPDLHDELDLEAYRKYHKKIFKGEKILSEAKIRRRDGVKVDTEFNNSRISISGKFYMHTTARDISGRKQAEADLKQSEERYRNLFENSPIGIAITSKDGILLQANYPFALMYGYKDPHQMAAELDNVRNLFSFLEKRSEIIENFNENGKIDAKEFEVIKRDGTHFFVLSSGVEVRDEDGNFLFYQSTHIDLTERKKNEEIIKTSEAEYRSLFENSIMGISQALPDGKIIRINKAYADMYGYPDIGTMMKEMSASTKKLYSNPDDRKMVLKKLDESGYIPPTEFELNRRNGEKFWALVGAKQVKDNSGKFLYLQAEHIDITDRKKLEKEMYSASLYARSLIEASLDPLVTINIEGKITDVNNATEQITGIKRGKLIGTDFADYFTDRDKARAGYETVFKKGIVKNYLLSILHTSGREIDVLYNASLFKNEFGEVQGVFAAARDITDQKKMEKELQQSHELLEKLNQHLVNAIEEERNQIALNLHDDLGQKLTAINLDILWLKSRIGVQSRTVQEKLEEMNIMIKETIESTKKTSAFLRPAILFDLGLVSAIKSHLDSFEKQTGIECNFCYNPEEFLLEDQLSLILYRIFQESMTNIARHAGASTAEVNLSVFENRIELIIKDDGIGIERSKVNSIKSMGIAGIKERVKSVNGKMNIVGERGSGSMICVEIPIPKVKTDD